MTEKQEPPRIKATRFTYADGTPGLRFPCPFCKTRRGKPHVHCHGEPAGHRVAHCFDPRSPFLERGYVLEV